MNRYLPVVSTLGIITATTLQPQAALALEPAEIYAKAKEFTVQIDGEETGTGTIIGRINDTYIVITCWHVMDTPGNYQITTPDGNTHQVVEVENLPDIDLATITFNSSNAYSIAELGNSTIVTSGLNAYVVGYPDPFPGVPERQYFTDSAEVQSRLSQGENGYQIIHDGSFTPGSSGGGIFDSQARLIGINGQFISEGNTGKAYGTGVPLELYLAAADNFATPTNVLPPQDFVSIGKRKLNERDYQAAVIEFDRALASNPSDLNALSGRAEAYYWQRNFQAALQDLNTVLEQDPDNAIFFFYRGYIYGELKRPDLAIADYTKAINLNSQNSDAYYNRGFNHNNLNKYTEAIADFTQAINLNPQNSDAYYNRGSSYSNLNQHSQAIADFTQAINLNPQNVLFYFSRGFSYYNLRQYSQAIADFTQTINLDPQNALAYNNRGFSYYELRQYTEAIADFTQAINLDPQNALAYNNRGLMYEQIGNKQQAIQDFQYAANLYQNLGNIEFSQQALDRIRKLQYGF